MSDLDLDAIKKRHASEPREKWRRDAAVYASYRDVPALVAEVERLRALAEQYDLHYLYAAQDRAQKADAALLVANYENARLRAENADLRTENAQLSAEVLACDVLALRDVIDKVRALCRESYFKNDHGSVAAPELTAILDSVNGENDD